MTGPTIASNIAVPDFSWTDERVARLRKLWTRGFTAEAIADELGCGSRSAVLGKVHRLRLSLRARDQAPKTAEQRRDAENHRKRLARATNSAAKNRGIKQSINHRRGVEADGDLEVLPLPDQASDLLIPAEQRKTLFQLTPETCRWPVGDPRSKDFFYCGAKSSSDGGPYCEGHARVAYSGHGNGRDPRHYSGHRQI